jgi:fumarate hydratase subunit beta
MDKTLEFLYLRGVIATVGKGKRTDLAVRLCREYQRAYFVTVSGAAAALMTKIASSLCLAYPDLGAEAIYLVEVVDFPLITAIDSQGNDIFADR